jgi:hypothetical protein
MAADADPIAAFRRLTGGTAGPDVAAASAVVTARAAEVAAGDEAAGVPDGAVRAGEVTADPGTLLDALVVLRWLQGELAAMEPALITAARAAGVSWQALAPALGVASRQAAERRYLRLVPAPAGQPGGTRDGRVRAERNRRAGHRAVAQWAKENTGDLRQLAGQVTALADLGTAAAGDIGRLRDALGDSDAAQLPGLLADAHRHLGDHPELAGRIDAVTAHTDRVRRRTEQRRGG